MMRDGHYGTAMLAALPLVMVLGPGHRTLSVVGVLGAVVGSRLPDVDQRVPFVPHRGPTHTIWFAILVGLVGGGVCHTLSPTLPIQALLVIGGGPGLGVLSHLVADAITPAGVRPLWPLSRWLVSAGIVRAENGVANTVLFVLGLLSVGVALVAGPIVVLGGR